MFGSGEDFFRTPGDLAEAEHRINVLGVMGRLFEALLGREAPPDWPLWHEGMIARMEDVTLGSMIWTAASQAILGGEWRLAPLRASEWEAAWPALHPTKLERVIGDWARSVLKEPGQIDLAARYLGPLHQEYAHQRRSLQEAARGAPDPRLTTFFLFTIG
jgi:hypothetical protein